MVEHDVARVLDVDPVLAADDGHVAKRDVTRPHDDAAAHDSADERLGVADHERSLHGAVQMHRRRSNRVGPAKAADQRPRPQPP